MTNQKPEIIWNTIINLLNSAYESQKNMDLRLRLNPHHPEEQKQQEQRECNLYSHTQFFSAKHMYYEYKEEMDLLYKEKTELYGFCDQEILLFKAMLQVIEDEISTEFEKQILQEDIMSMVKNKRFELDLDLDDIEQVELETQNELDEDEQYVKETEVSWDNDDIIGEDDDDFEFVSYQDLDEDDEDDFI